MSQVAADAGRLTRRDLIQVGCSTALGLGLSTLLARQSRAAQGATPRARSVLFLFLFGGPSHLDTFDPKPEAPDECRGEFRPIDTSVPGVQICEHLPRMAQRMHHWALIRSMTCNPRFGDHRQAVQGLLGGVDASAARRRARRVAARLAFVVRGSRVLPPLGERFARQASCCRRRSSIPAPACIRPRMRGCWERSSIPIKSAAIRPIGTIASTTACGCRSACRLSGWPRSVSCWPPSISSNPAWRRRSKRGTMTTTGRRRFAC